MIKFKSYLIEQDMQYSIRTIRNLFEYDREPELLELILNIFVMPSDPNFIVNIIDVQYKNNSITINSVHNIIFNKFFNFNDSNHCERYSMNKTKVN